MTDLKITKGEWANLSGYIVCKGGYNVCSVNSHNTSEGKSNAQLIAEAGLTPRELLEQRDELLAACKKYQSAISKVLAGGCVDPDEWYEDILSAQNIGAQYIRKAEG